MKKIRKYWFIPLLVAILVYYYFQGEEFEKEIQLKGRFTIGQITSTRPGRPEPDLVFRYIINGVLYLSQTPPYDKSLIGKRFYVAYLDDDKKDGVILLFYPVPDSIKEAPSNGWNTIPKVDIKMRDSLNLYHYAERSNIYLRKENWR